MRIARCACAPAARSVDVAVRWSATAEDLPDASFAGQQETFLNVRGETALLDACRSASRRCSPTGRSATGRNHGFDQLKVALSVGVQRDGALRPRRAPA